jgi:hypothetical protein
MLTNIFDYMLDAQDEFIFYSLHIPDHPYYMELGMPFMIDGKTGVIYDASGEPAILTVALINSVNWEIVDE